MPESSAIAQRIVRANRTLAEAHVAFRSSHRPGSRWPPSSSVLEVIYLIFNEGYSATALPAKTGCAPALCEGALRLGRILAGLAPLEPEVHGLVALMEIQASRHAARVGPEGEPILLLEQDRSRWDQILISRGLTALARAEELNSTSGPYTLQAAIAACHALTHASARRPTGSVHRRALRDALLRTPALALSWSLNRAVALAMAFGPEVGLELVDSLADEPSLANYIIAFPACVPNSSSASDGLAKQDQSSNAPHPSRAILRERDLFAQPRAHLYSGSCKRLPAPQ